jgi:hypothetical protein
MSRERRRKRDQRQRAERLDRMIRLIADAEGRTLDSTTAREEYLRELMIRGVVVDMGPHPSGQGRRVSFRLENIQGQVSLEQLGRLLSEKRSDHG